MTPNRTKASFFMEDLIPDTSFLMYRTWRLHLTISAYLLICCNSREWPHSSLGDLGLCLVHLIPFFSDSHGVLKSSFCHLNGISQLFHVYFYSVGFHSHRSGMCDGLWNSLGEKAFRMPVCMCVEPGTPMEVTLKPSNLSPGILLKCYVHNNRHHLIIVAVTQIQDQKKDTVKWNIG